MNTLYDLVKRIDALTANSQQVLNALIRSCLATGSSSGYKVKKFTQTIEMTRADIYRLYDFYNTWEQAGFPDDDTFDRLLSKADTRWHRSSKDGTQLATDAVVKHSKILYMDSVNQSQTDDSYWVEKIKTSASGKAVVSTAPIPINLRTPLYDENLSVKSFSQYETYLFPIGYRRTEILGTPNNGEDYVAGGQNWEIDATDFLKLNASHITMGHVTGLSPKDVNYGNSYYTFSWGDESYALGIKSFAVGDHNIAIGYRSAAVGGYQNYAYGSSSLATGDATVTLGVRSAAFNASFVAGSDTSIAANWRTVTGGFPYAFTVRTVDPVTVDGKVVCTGSGTTTGECYLEDVGATTEIANLNVLHISMDRYEKLMPYFDLQVGDFVQIYNIYGMKNGRKIWGADDGGYVYPRFTSQIVQITGADGEYDITLDTDLPANPLMMPAGGRIQTYLRNGSSLGAQSNAFNAYTIAHGEQQTVVGTSNQPNDAARFIVGVGSRLPTIAGNDPETGMARGRANGMAIAPKYGYMKTYNGSAGVSVSDTDIDADGYHLYPGAVMRGGASTNNHSRIAATEQQSLMLSKYNGNEIARVGTAVKTASYSNKGFVSAIFSSLQGTAVISSGSYIKATAGESTNLIDTLINQSKIIDGSDEDHNVAIYSEDGIEIRSVGTKQHGIHIWANSYLRQTFNGLILEGNTFGTLTATDAALSFPLGQKAGGQGTTGKLDDILWGETTGHSGFYYGRIGLNNFALAGTENWNTNMYAHIFNSTRPYGSTGSYNTALIALPDMLSATQVVRPIVSSVEYDGIGNTNTKPIVRYAKELAYVDDIAIASGWMLSCGFKNKLSTTHLSVQYGPTNTAMLPAVFREHVIADVYHPMHCLTHQSNGGTICSMNIYEYDTNNMLMQLDFMQYSLIGNQLTLTFDAIWKKDSDIKGEMYIPVLCNCGITKNDTSAYTYRLTGTSVKVNHGTYATVEGGIDGVALSNGLVILRIRISDFDEWERQPSEYDGAMYHCTVTGIVPFIVAQECVGHNNTTAAALSSIESSVAQIQYTWEDLAGTTDAPTNAGMLVQIFKDADSSPIWNYTT